MSPDAERGRVPGSPALLRLVRLVGLALLLWAFATEVRPSTAGSHLAAWALAASEVPAWVAWTVGGGGHLRRLVTFFWLGAVGGVLGVFAPAALAFVGSAGLGAGTGLEMPAALGVSAAGPAAALVAALVAGRPLTWVLASGAVALAGVVLGVGRRQATQQAAQAAAVALAHERAEVAQARADVFAERNRLAREVHDVLAHTLGALAVQLEALAATVDGDPTAPAALADGLRRTRGLAVDGLAEARRAVQALHDDATPLAAQLGRLCEARGAVLHVSGDQRPLDAEATVALARVVQESLTNAAKHAPRAPVRVELDFGAGGSVAVSVVNDESDLPVGDLAGTGGGYGLEGLAERVRLIGGTLSAGPAPGGWAVEARIVT